MRNILPVGVILIGIGCLIYGVGLILPAAAWIVGGFFGLVLGVLMIAGGDAAEGGDSPSPGAAAPPSPAGGGRESPVRAVRGGTDVGGDCG